MKLPKRLRELCKMFKNYGRKSIRSIGSPFRLCAVRYLNAGTGHTTEQDKANCD